MKKVAISAAKIAGNSILKYYNRVSNPSYIKNSNDIFTKADIESERKIIEIISKKYPTHNIISEEKGFIDKNSEYSWIIDPLDGTFFFKSGIPMFSVSIGLKYMNETKLGVVYNPYSKELFFAEKGNGAYLNNKKINVNAKKSLLESIVSFDYPTSSSIKGVSLFSLLQSKLFFSRVFASEVLEICYVACGRFDANICYQAKLWDIAASSLILQEAGGKITDFKGNKLNLKNERFDVVASNDKIHNQLIREILKLK